jgi:hypothetical protein
MSGHSVAVFDPCGRVLLADEPAGEILGFDDVAALEAMDPNQLAERFVVESPNAPAAAPVSPFVHARVFRGLDEPERLLRFRDPKRGWDRWVRTRAHLLTHDDGHPMAALCEIEDVTSAQRRVNQRGCFEEASQRLSRTLSEERVLQQAVLTCVPWLAEECVVAGRAANGGLTAWAWNMPGAGATEAQALVAAMDPRAQDAFRFAGARLVAVGNDPDDERSVLVAPIRFGCEVFALLVCAMAKGSARRHHPEDAWSCERLAGMIGCAVASVRLARQAREQSTLLATA